MRVVNYRTISLVAALLLTAGTANAANLVKNGSFEEGSFVPDARKFMQLSAGATDLTAWSISGSTTLGWRQYIDGIHDSGVAAHDGNYSLDFTGTHDGDIYPTLSQVIETVINQQYLVTFYVGAGGGERSIIRGFEGPAKVLASAGGTTFIGANMNGLSRHTTWVQNSFSFIATSTATVLSFTGYSKTGCCLIALDDVSVTAVPEPETLSMLLAGLGVTGAFVRRRRNTG